MMPFCFVALGAMLPAPPQLRYAGRGHELNCRITLQHVTIRMSQFLVVVQGDQRTVLQPPATSRLRGMLCDLEHRAHHKRNGFLLLPILVEPATG